MKKYRKEKSGRDCKKCYRKEEWRVDEEEEKIRALGIIFSLFYLFLSLSLYQGERKREKNRERKRKKK